MGQHLAEPAPAVRGERRVVGRPRGGDRRQDPAARGEDLEVARALLAEEQLVLARAGEQQVGVGVDEARRDGPAARVQPGEPGQRQALRLELRLDGRPRTDGAIRPSQQATTGASGAPGRRPRRRPGPRVSPWVGPRRRPPAIVAISAAPMTSRPFTAPPRPPRPP